MDRDGRVVPNIPGAELDDFQIKGAASRALHGPTSTGSAIATDCAPDTCTICLQPITERAVAVPCDHLTFDFICLASWLQEQTSCPLCKATIATVQYDWREPTDFKTYHVEQAREKSDTVAADRTRRPPSGAHDGSFEALAIVDSPSLALRRMVYRDKLYALHIGGNARSRFVDFSPKEFASSPELQSRARSFLRRELLVFTFLDHDHAMRASGRQYLVEYIVAVLKIHHPKSANGQAEEMLTQSLGRENAVHLLHELLSWLRSPCARLVDWDGIVQYDRNTDAETNKQSNSSHVKLRHT